jgi:hypothetical protein
MRKLLVAAVALGALSFVPACEDSGTAACKDSELVCASNGTLYCFTVPGNLTQLPCQCCPCAPPLPVAAVDAGGTDGGVVLPAIDGAVVAAVPIRLTYSTCGNDAGFARDDAGVAYDFARNGLDICHPIALDGSVLGAPAAIAPTCAMPE